MIDKVESNKDKQAIAPNVGTKVRINGKTSWKGAVRSRRSFFLHQSHMPKAKSQPTWVANAPVTEDGAQTLTGKTMSGASNTFSNISLSSSITGTLPVANGGTGQTTYTNGQLLIGNSTGNTLTKATLTAGSNISITNGTGSITIDLPSIITVGELRSTGNVTAYYSDERLKTRLGAIDSPLDKVQSLSGFYYQANELAQALGYDVKKEVGVSAQEVAAVMPEIVAEAPIDPQYMTVRYERLVPLLIEAIKELKAKVEALEAK